MQDGRRVGRIADDHEVRVLRYGRRIQPEAVLGPQHHPLDPVAGVPQGRLRLGELRVHHDRPFGAEGPRDQYEGLRRPRRQQDVYKRQG